jgi:hypothetical protein
MTENKARKEAIRWRMQQTGEPYSVAARNIDKPSINNPSQADPATAGRTQAEQDALFAWSCGTNAVIRMDQVAGSSSPQRVFEDYARFIFDELDGDRKRIYATARQACLKAAETVAAPGIWRTHLRAIELCRRAAVMPADPDDAPDQLAVWETAAGAHVILSASQPPSVAEWHCQGCGKTTRYDNRPQAEAYGWQHAELCAT